VRIGIDPRRTRRGRTCSRCGSAGAVSVLGSVADEVAAGRRTRRRWSRRLPPLSDHKPYGDASSIELDSGDFASGSLRGVSYARPTKLFTANRNLITSQVAHLKPDALRTITQAVTRIISAGKLP
jgi:hypothetical protein